MPNTPRIVTRSETTSSNTTENLNKGSKLTFAEMDSNFLELRNGSIGIVGDDSTGIDLAHGSTLKVAGTGGIATSVSGDTLTIDASSIVTSTLGDLTAVGSTLIAPSNADLTLTVAGTGQIVVDGTLTATEVISDLTGTIEFDAKATEAITKGQAVYIAGIDGNTPTVGKARANSSSTMPGFGIAADDIALNATGKITTFGSLTGLDVADFGETSITFALRDTLYVSSAEAGKLTNVAPTGESNFIQNIGKIERATPTTNITIKVGGAGRSNATPALNEGNIFIGNASNQSSTVALSDQIKNYKAITVVGDDSTGTDVNIGESFKMAGTQNITTAVSGDTLTITGPDLTSYLENVVEDTTPQLGGDLDVNGNAIKGSTVSILGATGELMITATENGPVALRYDNNLKLTTKSDGVDITGELQADSLDIDGNADITGTLNTHTIPGGTGTIALTSDITGISNVVEDTTPQLGGDLDVNSNNITGTGDINITGSIANEAITISQNNISATRSGDDLVLSSSGSGDIRLDGNRVYVGDDDSTGPNPFRYYSTTTPPTISAPNSDDDLVFRTTDSQTDIGGRFVFLNGSGSKTYVVIRNGSPTTGQAYVGGAGPGAETIIANGLQFENNLSSDPHTLYTPPYQTAQIKVKGGAYGASGDIDLIPYGSGEVNITNVDIGSGAIDGTTIGAASAAPGTFTNLSANGTITMNSNRITNVTDPTSAQDAATKAYVDANVGGGGAANTGDITFIGSTMLGPSNADITIQPSGTGDIHLKTDGASDVKIGELTTNSYWQFLPDNGILRWNSSTGNPLYIDHSNGGQIKMDGPTDNGDIRLQTLTGGEVIVGPQDLDARITTDGTASLIINTNSGTNSGSVVINEGVNGNINITPDGTGKVVISGLAFPDTDGTADQILGTNGSGVLSFRDPTAINIDGGTADSVYTSVPTIDGGTA
jgi:hypothetical protein